MTETQPAIIADPESAWTRDGIAAPRNVITLMIRKGGAGKTTLILLLADALARMGLNVLVLDLDSQGNASFALGREVKLIDTGKTERLGGKHIREADLLTVCEVLIANAPGVVSEAVIPATWEYDPGAPFTRGGPLFPGRIGTIGVVPCHEALESLIPGWATPADLQRLATGLLLPAPGQETAPSRQWDVVLIDTPPSGSSVHTQALLASTGVLFAAAAAIFAAKSVPKSTSLVDDVIDKYHHPLDLLGIIINHYSRNRVNQRTALAELAEARDQAIATGDEELRGYRVPEFPGRIPLLDVVEASQGFQAPVSALLTLAQNRKAATRVCMAAERNAIELLASIGHPDAAGIRQAWQDAWPPDLRALEPDAHTGA